MKVGPEIIPAVTQDGSPDMGNSLSTLRVPTHARLIDATAHDLFDTAFSRAATDLKPLLDIHGIVHTRALVLEVGDVRIPMKSSTSSGHVDHQSERSDAGVNIIHSSGRHGQVRVELTSGLSLEIEPVGIVDQAVQDGIPDGWIGKADVPLCNGHLSGDHSG